MYLNQYYWYYKIWIECKLIFSKHPKCINKDAIDQIKYGLSNYKKLNAICLFNITNYIIYNIYIK